MDKAKRKAIIAGNWKMNKTASEAAVLVDELIPAVKDATCEVVICTPFTDLVTAVAKTKGTNIHVGAENVHFEKSGAFTGEISADMLVDLGVEYGVIKKGGSWFSYGDRRLGQGRDNVKQLIKDEPEFAAQLEQEIKEKIAEVQAASDKKYQPKAAPKADTEPEPAEESTARQTRAAARAKLDIAVEDDDE